MLLKKKPQSCAVRRPATHATVLGYGLLHTCCSRAMPESLTQFIWEHSPLIFVTVLVGEMKTTALHMCAGNSRALLLADRQSLSQAIVSPAPPRTPGRCLLGATREIKILFRDISWQGFLFA